MSQPLSQFLYLSHIEGDRPFETLSAVVAQARGRNLADGVTGVLLFDGAGVCQYVEGEPDVIDALIQRLENDTRHRRLAVLHHGPLLGERRFARWSLGYMNLDDGHDVSSFEALRGEAAVQAVIASLPAADLEP